jgi:hypothetical protein
LLENVEHMTHRYLEFISACSVVEPDNLEVPGKRAPEIFEVDGRVLLSASEMK